MEKSALTLLFRKVINSLILNQLDERVLLGKTPSSFPLTVSANVNAGKPTKKPLSPYYVSSRLVLGIRAIRSLDGVGFRH